MKFRNSLGNIFMSQNFVKKFPDEVFLLQGGIEDQMSSKPNFSLVQSRKYGRYQNLPGRIFTKKEPKTLIRNGIKIPKAVALKC